MYKILYKHNITFHMLSSQNADRRDRRSQGSERAERRGHTAAVKAQSTKERRKIGESQAVHTQVNDRRQLSYT